MLFFSFLLDEQMLVTYFEVLRMLLQKLKNCQLCKSSSIKWWMTC